MKHTPGEARRYAAIAVFDLAAWALRMLHIRRQWVWAVEDMAAVRAYAASLDWRTEEGRTAVPIGFSCEHASLSVGGGHFTARPVVGCGCTMQPTFQAS